MKPPYPPGILPRRPGGFFRPRHSPTSLSVRTFGLRLVLASLIMLFGGSIAGYLLMWSRSLAPPPALPVGLWVSTGVLLASGAAMEWARWGARRQVLGRMKRGVVVSLVLALVFLAVQTPSAIALLRAHAAVEAGEGHVGLYGLTFTLILLHALHVLGGLVPLGVLAGRCLRGTLTLEHAHGVRLTAVYWHFLGVVWVVMFSVFLLVA